MRLYTHTQSYGSSSTIVSMSQVRDEDTTVPDPTAGMWRALHSHPRSLAPESLLLFTSWNRFRMTLVYMCIFFLCSWHLQWWKSFGKIVLIHRRRGGEDKLGEAVGSLCLNSDTRSLIQSGSWSPSSGTNLPQFEQHLFFLKFLF